MTDGTQIPEGGATPERRSSPNPPDPRAPRTIGPDETITMGRVPAQPPVPQPPVPQPQPPGYGYPQQPAPQPGYGYPQQPAPQPGYGYPAQQSAPQFAGPSQPQPSQFQVPGPYSQSGTEPDWTALAEDQAKRDRRARRLRIGGGVLVACLLGVGAGVFLLNGTHTPAKPDAHGTSGAPVASGKPTTSATTLPPTTQPGVIPDSSGQTPLVAGPDAVLAPVAGGSALQLRGDLNSFGQTSQSVVDVQHSFTVSAWVYTDVGFGSRSVISQGDGSSYSFDLGRSDNNGHKAWMFKVQTADGGADSTSFQAVSANVTTTGSWVLLTGTYDADAHRIALFVNGAQVGSTKVPGIWSGPGPLQIGRARYHGIWANFWKGTVGHVQVWGRALSPAETAGLKKGQSGTGTKPIDSWMTG